MALIRQYIRLKPYLVRFKSTLDYSKVPILVEKDIEEMFVRGSGPGGQKINKTSSCVVLKHMPTGILVKCQETRFLEKNRRIARELLQKKLDNFINQENSIENQIKLDNEKRNIVKEQKKVKLKVLKEAWKKREFGIEDN